MYRASIALAAALGAASVMVDVAAALEIEWVVVDAVGNPADDEEMICCFELIGTTGFGSVPYLYRISRYEITNGQYTEFLNAIARSDPNSVYATNMAGERGGLVRSGPNGSYTYSPKPGLDDHPVNYIEVYRAFRFANWLHNGKPSGPQNATTTEDGSYTLLGSNPVEVQRNPGARFFVPNEDEWYKAAYYDPSTQTYFDWAMGADPRPDADAPPGGLNTCNYVFPPRSCPDVSSGICAQTEVGAYPDASSPFGTYDQCGNLWEVTETPAVAAAQIIVRGSSWAGGFIDAASFGRNDARMSCPNGCWGVGMRIATVPEPVSSLGGGVALVALSLLVRCRSTA